MLAHAPDLTVQPLHQGNAEDKRRFFFDFALFRHRPEDRHPRPHTTNKFIGNRFIDRHQILFLMIVTRTEDLIHQIAVIGEENQSLGVFIQAANREHAFAVVNEIDNVIALAIFGGADNTDGLVQGDKYQIFGFPRFNQLTVYFHNVAGFHLIANGGSLAIKEHIALLDIAIRFAA